MELSLRIDRVVLDSQAVICLNITFSTRYFYFILFFLNLAPQMRSISDHMLIGLWQGRVKGVGGEGSGVFRIQNELALIFKSPISRRGSSEDSFVQNKRIARAEEIETGLPFANFV